MLGDSLNQRLDDLLADDDAVRAARYPGPRPGRQPVHTVYVPADRYHRDLVAQWREAALDVLAKFGPLPGFESAQWTLLEPLVVKKLHTEPIEDLRIDFEDGYGIRPEDEEDAEVVRTADAVADCSRAGDLPHGVGLRIKSLEGPTRVRAVRTLDLFLNQLLAAAGDSVPDGFRITLPKVTSVAQVRAMVELCRALETEYGLARGRLPFEIQIETPQSIVGADGTATVARMVHASGGRCVGLHYGTYDYSAALGVAAAYQSMEHPAADHAKQVLQVAAAGTGVPVSDGSTNVVPVGGVEEVRAAWALHARLVRRSLERGFYQGWDLHPAQLPSRHAATFAFYLDGAPAAVDRLSRYLARSAGGFLDEPATAQALAGYLVRGLDCGALTEDGLIATAPSIDPATLHRLARR